MVVCDQQLRRHRECRAGRYLRLGAWQDGQYRKQHHQNAFHMFSFFANYGAGLTRHDQIGACVRLGMVSIVD